MIANARAHALLLVAALALMPAATFAEGTMTAVVPAASFSNLITNAQAKAASNRPDEALAAYREALDAARGDATRERTARFGVARMQLWLGRYEDARDTFAALLRGNLVPEDREIALAGEVKSLSYLDRPRSAYHVAGDGTFDNPDLALAAARAAVWSGLPDRARVILDRNRESIAAIPPTSALAAQARSVSDEVRRETAPSIAVGDAYAHDSDGLDTNDVTLDVRAPLGNGNVDIVSRRYDFSQPGWSLSGRSTQAGYSGRVGESVTVAAAAGTAGYDGWNPGIWSGEVAVQPTDHVRITAYGQREVVETQSAIADRLTSTGVGANARFRANRFIDVSAGATSTRFSDGNVRSAMSGTVSAAVLPALGIGVEVRERAFHDRNDAAVGYFAPPTYAETQYVLTAHRFVRGWRIAAQGGFGRQSIPGQSRTTTSVAGVTLDGPLSGCLRVQAAASDTDSGISSASGYRRMGTSLRLSCAF